MTHITCTVISKSVVQDAKELCMFTQGSEHPPLSSGLGKDLGDQLQNWICMPVMQVLLAANSVWAYLQHAYKLLVVG